MKRTKLSGWPGAGSTILLMFAAAVLALGFGCNGDGDDEDADAQDTAADEVMEVVDDGEDAEDIPAEEAIAEDVVDDSEDVTEEEEEPLPQPSRVIILHTNDEHSHLLGIGPSVDDFPFPEEAGDGSIIGNIYRRAILLNRERGAAIEDGIPTVTVSAGDFSMGTLFQFGSVFQGADFKAMTLLGYDAIAIGNHEFDFGAPTLATMLENGGLMDPLPLSIPVLSSNIHFSSSTSDDALEDLYAFDGSGGALLKGYKIKTLSDGTTIGFIGLLGLSASLDAVFKSPVQFSLSMTDTTCEESYECENGSCVDGFCSAGPLQDHGAHMPALIADAAAAVRAVRLEGVDLVVALAHVGVDQDEADAIAAGTLNPADAVHSEDIIMARGVAELLAGEDMLGIDVIIGGHSHSTLPKPIVIPDPGGGEYSAIIVETGEYGQNLGRLEIYRDDVGEPWKVETDGSYLIEVNDSIDPSELPGATKGLLDDVTLGVIGAIEELVLEDALNVYNPGDAIVDDTEVLGDLFFYTLAEADFDVLGGSHYGSSREYMLMHLVTDALRHRMNTDIYSENPVNVYVQANGVIRDSLLAGRADGALSAADVFSVVPLGVSPIEETPGYPLIDFYFAAAELKAGLEVGLSMGFDSGSFFLGYSGIKVEYDPNLPAFDPDNPTTTGRITKMTLWDPEADAGLEPWEDDYTDVIFDITVTPDPFAGRSAELLHVASNLYIGLFIENFGLCPRDAAGVWDPMCGLCANTDDDCDDGAGNTATCLNDIVEEGIGRCVAGSIPAVIHYLTYMFDEGPEMKEWTALFGYLQNMEDTDENSVPNLPDAYNEDGEGVSFPSRVCCVQSPLSEEDPCCHEEPCANAFIACP
ncbi:MAG: 5'-nucleotidase C-terminal domain-containing protein [Pseudomonadota bacterium]